jgi:hypothetical protein
MAMKRRACLLRLLFFLLLPTVALAQAQQPACPDGNLLLGKSPIQVLEVLRSRAITDGGLPHEGSHWDTSFTSVLSSEFSFLVFDLGEPTGIDSLLIQADNNDTFEISASFDGKNFGRLTGITTVPNPGMQTRLARDLHSAARFLRISQPKGDGYFSIGEFQVFCQTPSQWPPKLPRFGRVPAAPQTGSDLPFDQWWGNREHRLSVHKIVIGVLGLLAFLGFLWEPLRKKRIGSWVGPGGAVGVVLYTALQTWGIGGLVVFAVLSVLFLFWIAGQKKRGKRWIEGSQRTAMIALLIVGGLTWSNFGTFHGIRGVHLWDFMHYYMGSKYFAENDYRWLYHCGMRAELDDGHTEEVRGRKYRSLKDNRLGPAEWIFEEATTVCRENFEPQRWRAFRQDIRLFRSLMGPGWFKGAFEDHGYNATPPWNMVGSVLSNWDWESEVPPSHLVNSPINLAGKTPAQVETIRQRFFQDRDTFYFKVKLLALIDGVLYASIFLMIVWAFGLPAGALAILAWSVGHPWAYYWTGGSLGRVPWLFTAVAGLCFLKKGYHALGGAGLAWTLLLRVFPGALAGGIALKVLWNGIVERRIDPTHLRVLIGAVVAAGLIVMLSLPSSGGFSAYSGFLENSIKHKSTPLTNHMGLPTLISLDTDNLARHMADNRTEDPFENWKHRRQELQEERKVLYWGLLLGMFALVGWAARKMENWEATAISTLFILGVFELTNYYYCFLVVLAPFCIRRPSYAAALIAASVGTQIIALLVGMEDERGLMNSALALALMLFVIGSEIWRQRQLEDES